MAWYSILPPDLIYVESWAARIFVRPPFPSSPPLEPRCGNVILNAKC